MAEWTGRAAWRWVSWVKSVSSARPGPAQIFPRSPRLCNIHFADVFPRRMRVSSHKNERSPSLPASDRSSGNQPLATAPQSLFLSPCWVSGSVTSRSAGPTPGLAPQQAANRVLNALVNCGLELLSWGASTGIKTGGLLASVWDCLPVACVSTQCLREKNEVMRLHCLLTFQAEGGRVRLPSGLIVFAWKRRYSVWANKNSASELNFNESTFICTALNHNWRRLKGLCSIRRKQTGLPKQASFRPWPGKAFLCWHT